MARGKKGTGTGAVYARGNSLWLRYYDEKEKLHRVPSGYSVGEEAKAKKFLAGVEARVRVAKRAGITTGRLTVAQYAKQWLDERDGRVASIRHERARQRDYIGPALGSLFMDEVTPRDLSEFVKMLRRKRNPDLAPRTIRSIWGQVRGMFKSAFIDGVISLNPAVLKAGVLPAKEDKDPEWREGAIFSRDEVLQLITDERIPDDRRVLYTIKALTGARHGEVAGLCWRHIDFEANPLPRMVVANSYQRPGTKTRKTRAVPVHPYLSAVLRHWREDGWPRLMGRAPGQNDRIVPTMRDSRRAEAFRDDLRALGLRHRRGHDFRRTFISLGQDAGAGRNFLEAITHKGNQSVISGYTTFAWGTLCDAVAAIPMPEPPRPPGGVIPLPGLCTSLAQHKKKAPEGAETFRVSQVRRGGLESPPDTIHPSHDDSNCTTLPLAESHGASQNAAGCARCANLADAARAILAVADAGGDVAAVVGYLRHALNTHESAAAGRKQSA